MYLFKAYIGLNVVSGYHSAITIYCHDATIKYGPPLEVNQKWTWTDRDSNPHPRKGMNYKAAALPSLPSGSNKWNVFLLIWL